MKWSIRLTKKQINYWKTQNRLYNFQIVTLEETLRLAFALLFIELKGYLNYKKYFY